MKKFFFAIAIAALSFVSFNAKAAPEAIQQSTYETITDVETSGPVIIIIETPTDIIIIIIR